MMTRTNWAIGTAIAAVLLVGSSGIARAATAEAKCQAGKNKEAEQYASCLQKAEAKLVGKAGVCSITMATVCYRDAECPIGEACTKDLTKYNQSVTRCETKFTDKWGGSTRRPWMRGPRARTHR